jgi:hypothetical protein
MACGMRSILGMRCRASTDLADAPIRAALRFKGSMCCSIRASSAAEWYFTSSQVEPIASTATHVVIGEIRVHASAGKIAIFS